MHHKNTKVRCRKKHQYRPRLNRPNTFPQSMARQGNRSFSGPFSRPFFVSFCRLPDYMYAHTSQSRDTVSSLHRSYDRTPRQPPGCSISSISKGFLHKYQHRERQGHRIFSGPFSRSIFAPFFGLPNFPHTNTSTTQDSDTAASADRS